MHTFYSEYVLLPCTQLIIKKVITPESRSSLPFDVETNNQQREPSWTELGVGEVFEDLGQTEDCRTDMDVGGKLPSVAIIRFERVR